MLFNKGEVSEWFKVHAWNACVDESLPGGSNLLSAENKMKKNIYIIITLLSFIISKDLNGIGCVFY